MKIEYGPTRFIINKDWSVVLACPSCQEPTKLGGRTLYAVDPTAHWVLDADQTRTGKYRCASTW